MNPGTDDTPGSTPGVTLLCRRTAAGTGPRRGEPVRCGVPWAEGTLTDPSLLELRDAEEAPVDAQFEVLERWPDGSVRWILVDWRATLSEGRVEARYRLSIGRPHDVDRGEPETSEPPGTEALERARTLLRTPDSRCRWVAVTPDGRRFDFQPKRFELETNGPLRQTVLVEGRFLDASGNDESLADGRVRLDVYPGLSAMGLDLAFTNPRAARHPGGRWSLGEEGSVRLESLDLHIRSSDAADPSAPAVEAWLRTSEGDDPVRRALSGAESLRLVQQSSGGAAWDSRVHVNGENTVPMEHRGWKLCAADGTEVETGLRATPTASLRGPEPITVTAPRFWEEFPKGVTLAPGGVTWSLLPAEFPDHHEVQGGERLSHRVAVALGDDPVTDEPLAWCRNPLLASCLPEAYAAADAGPHFRPASEDPNTPYLDLVDAALGDADGFFAKREAIDEYGWRHFGDLWADHEGVFAPDPQPTVSHYNNQYDGILGFAVQFLRSGDRRWWDLHEALARHFVAIDVYRTDRDKSTYNHGPFWHTVHYVDAGTSNHRAYPPVEGVGGGGPSTGNLYTAGLALRYLLTGDRDARDTVLELGTYVIDADDGGKSRFAWLDSGPTGHVSESGFDGYHGPGRSPGNAIRTLLDAFRLSGDRRYLDKAEELIRRCIHPEDDLEARNLLDAENRWFYTMFLQSLGHYLDCKAGLGEVDDRYAYAHASLLAYARWALDHERFYLDHPEDLEYPTETWAAQELRKVDVFDLGARLTSGPERRRFLERAREFFDYATLSLEAMPTRTLCRPLVLLAGHGYTRSWIEGWNPDELPGFPAAPPADYGRPVEFRSQRDRVKRRVQTWGVTGLLLLGLAGALLLGLL